MSKPRILYLTEGYVDKLLLTILEVHPKNIDIQKGNSGIAKTMKNHLCDYHKTIVALTDMDKKNIPEYFDDFKTLNEPDNITFKKKHNTNQYLIFLCCPAIENWLLNAAKEAQANMADFGITDEIEFRRRTKKQTVSKDENLVRFIRHIKRRNPEPFVFLKEIIDEIENKQN